MLTFETHNNGKIDHIESKFNKKNKNMTFSPIVT